MNVLFVIILTFIAKFGTRAQDCSDLGSAVVYKNTTIMNSAFYGSVDMYGDASIDEDGVRLGTTGDGSFGTLILRYPLDLDGTGGFSIKYSLKNLKAFVGDLDLLILPDEEVSSFLSQQRSPNSTNGVQGAGINSLNIKIRNSASRTGLNDIIISLAGKKVCESEGYNIPSGSDVSTIWLDFDGFASKLSVRMNNIESFRPEAEVSCPIDIWGTIQLLSEKRIGFHFQAGTATPVVPIIVGSFSIASAYRPFDSTDCASYASCGLQNRATRFCVKLADNSALCEVVSCESPFLAWDIFGVSCCGFTEKTIYSGRSVPAEAELGDLVSCSRSRHIVARLAGAENCVSL